MKKFYLELIRDQRGNISSKRHSFLLSVTNWLLMGWGAVIYLAYKEQYQLIVDLVQSVGLATLGLAGTVASEFFGKNKKETKDDEIL